MLRELKEFIARGNVLGLAVAVVLGAAFGVVVSSFVKDILMQLVAALGATPSFDNLSFTLNGAEIRYGAFLNAVVMFLIVSFVMFLVVKGYNRIVREKEKEEPASESELTGHPGPTQLTVMRAERGPLTDSNVMRTPPCWKNRVSSAGFPSAGAEACAEAVFMAPILP